MKKRFTDILIIVLFVSGLGFLLYPTISNIYNNINQSKVIANYVEKTSNMDKEEYNKVLEEAQEYNNMLLDKVKNHQEQFSSNSNYEKKYNILNGNIGYVEIPKINIKLPIYYGTKEEKLQVAVGLMENTSFPTDSTSTHTVLVGHRGLPSAKLFTNLDKLKIGDIFYINVLSEKYAFKVDQVKVVKPSELEYLKIVEGKTYATLVTCTPYGINSHRLLVRGEMVPLEEKEEIKEYKFTDKIYFDIEKLVIICWFVSLFTMIHCYRKMKFLK